jgi:hypothetical protein
VLLLHPWWTERVRLNAPAQLPVVGYLGSDDDSLSDYSRIWLLDQPGLPYAREDRFKAKFLSGRRRVGSEIRSGGFTLSLYENGRYEPTAFRASDVLARAQVAIDSTPCTLGPNQNWLCPAHVTVSTGWHELFYAPHHCIALEPPGGRSRLTLSFVDVPTTETLVLEAGIVWEHAAKHDPGMSALNVAVKASGESEPLAVLSIPPGQEGMKQVRVPGHTGPLEISVESTNRKDREACIELKAVNSNGGAR